MQLQLLSFVVSSVCLTASIDMALAASSSSTAAATKTIQTYLDQTEEQYGFFVQTWRWQTMALIRESRQLGQAATEAATTATASNANDDMEKDSVSEGLQLAANHVVNVNMKGLHNIETDLIAPWIKQKIAEPDSVAKAVQVLMQDLSANRNRVGQLGRDLLQQSNGFKGSSNKSKTCLAMAETCRNIAAQSQHALDVTDRYLAPVIQRQLPKSEQKALNLKLIGGLGGFWKAGVHLVGMYRATMDHSATELALFKERIPGFVQRLIPSYEASYDKSWASLLATKNNNNNSNNKKKEGKGLPSWIPFGRRGGASVTNSPASAVSQQQQGGGVPLQEKEGAKRSSASSHPATLLKYVVGGAIALAVPAAAGMSSCFAKSSSSSTTPVAAVSPQKENQQQTETGTRSSTKNKQA